MSIHDYDISRFLMNSEIHSVSSQGSLLVHSFMEQLNDVDQAMTYITFESGAAGDIEVSRNALYGYDIRAEIIGTEGSLFIGSLKYHNLHVLTTKGSLHDESPSVTAIDGMKALEIAVSAQNSLQTGIEVKVESIRKKV